MLPATLAQTTNAADAATPQAENTSFFEMFFWSDDPVGLLIIWLLVGLSVVSLTLTARFLMRYREPEINPAETRDRLEGLIRDKQYREALNQAQGDTTYVGRVTAAALNEASGGYPSMTRALGEQAEAEAAKMVRPVELLNVLGNIAPMIGLLGTVYGMIRAFQVLVATGGQPDPVLLAAGISTALVTTLWGLLVAIPALAGYALIRNRLDALTADAVLAAEALIRPFKPVPQRRPTAAARAAPAQAGGQTPPG